MTKEKVSVWRVFFILLLFALAAVGLVSRLIYLNIIDRPFLLSQSKSRIMRTLTIPAYRGMIVDRLNSPLAISTPVTTICANPKLYNATLKQSALLAKALRVNNAVLHQKISRAQKLHKEFLYLKRRLSPAVAKKIIKLNIPGVFSLQEYKRYYPEGAVAAHVVGLANIDDQGQEGLELAYNRWLSGQAGKKEVIKDRLGRTIANVGLLKKPEQGKELVLSLDHRIQYLAYRTLKAQVKKYHAKSGSVVVLDAKTGEILANVNQPSYNPNDPYKKHDGRFRNRALTDIFEPGSTMKPFTIALALDSKKYTPDSTVDTNPGRMLVGGYTIKDDGLNYGVINLTQVLQKSSNIGAAKIMLSLSPMRYWELLRQFGFGQRSATGFPGEVSGTLVARQNWYPSVVATLAYGYGIAVTALQLAHGYQILANHGIKMPLTFLKRHTAISGTRVIAAKVANEVVKMLETVVQKGGTGWRAHINGYRVAGKTGTAYIASKAGYDKHRFIASFVGVAPVSNPRLVVAVIIRDPQQQHFGGIVSAPVFAKVMSGALRILNIPPDNIKSLT